MKTPAWYGFVAGLALCSALAGRARADEPVVHHTLDDRNLERTRQISPQAVEDFLKAEELIKVGKLSEAQELLAQASAAVPKSPILARRHCEVLTELGERGRAVSKCRDMMPNATWPTAMDHHAYAAALMSGTDPPTPDEVVVAVRAAAAARQLVGQPFSDAAFCEVAHRLGDDYMFNQCIQNLQREAPGHYETKRWAALKKTHAGWPYLLGWGLLALTGLATVAHALRRRFRPALAAGATGAVLIALCILSSERVAFAQAAPPPEKLIVGQPIPQGVKEEEYKWQLSQFRINHDNPESAIPSFEARNAHPLEFGYFLQDLASEASYAERRNDDRAALKYWRALTKAVPDAASGFSKTCKAYYRLQEFDSARDYCTRALNLPGVTVGDYALYGELMTSKPGKPTPIDIEDVNAVIKHLQRQKGAELLAQQVTCQQGIQLEDQKRLETCTKALAKATPNDPQTLIFQWSYAMLRKDFGDARQLIARIKKTSAKPEAIARMEQATNKAGALWRRFGHDRRYQLGLALSLALGGVVLYRRRRAAKKAAPIATPSPPVPSPPSPGNDEAEPLVG